MSSFVQVNRSVDTCGNGVAKIKRIRVQLKMMLRACFVWLCVLAVGEAGRNSYNNNYQPRNGFGLGRNHEDRAGALGSDCSYDDHCNVDNSYCHMQMNCRCKRNYEPSASQDNCVARIGADCRSRFECSSLENGECRQSQCACREGFIAHQERACLRMSERIGDACEQDQQCKALGKNARCNNKRCACDQWEHISDGKCYPNKGLGQSCENNNECFIGDDFKGTVQCRSGVCQCREGYHATSERTCAGGNGAAAAQFSFIASILPILIIVSRQFTN